MSTKPSAFDSHPRYFYRVTQFVSLQQEAHPILPQPFHWDFEGDDLIACRSAAYCFCLDLMTEIEQSDTFLMESSNLLYNIGSDATLSLTVSLIEFFDEEDYNSYTLNSENMQVRKQSMEMEYRVLSEFCANRTAA